MTISNDLVPVGGTLLQVMEYRWYWYPEPDVHGSLWQVEVLVELGTGLARFDLPLREWRGPFPPGAAELVQPRLKAEGNRLLLRLLEAAGEAVVGFAQREQLLQGVPVHPPPWWR